MFTVCQHKMRFIPFRCLQRVNTGVIFDAQMKFGLNNRLAECRAAKGINKSQLAYRLKKSRAYVTRLERGDIKPSIEVALNLARYFGKSVEFIFQLAEETSVTISRPCPAAGGNHEQCRKPKEQGIKCN